ncbi:MAG: peptidoglycan D,D-transpeptidase FtsI family protein [Syntrophomonadaceae bacterium]
MRNRRIFLLMCTILVIYCGLAAKIGYYQLVKGHEIARKATAMRSRQIELKEYPRGDILDRNLLPLTSTQVCNAVYCLPSQIIEYYKQQNPSSLTDSDEDILLAVAKDIASLLEPGNITDIYKKILRGYRTGTPMVRIASDLSRSEVNKINNSDMTGIVVAPMLKRYRDDGFCSHIIGYVSGGDDFRGETGLEKVYNSVLNKYPSPYQELVSVVDARGAVIQGLMFKIRREQEKQQAAVVSTIDKRIQEMVETALDAGVEKGAAVVLDIETREILALASRPAFSPYDLERIIEHDTRGSFTNRALTSYHPGSLFKIFLTAVALEEKVLDLDDRFNCQGSYTFNPEVTISCWREEGHGNISFVEAFTGSCNPAFIEVGLRLGRNKLMEYAERLRLCDSTINGFDYKSSSFIHINPGQPALGNASLGQQGVMLTPLQLSSLIATIADDGYWAPPSIVRYTIGQDGKASPVAGLKKEAVLSRDTCQKVQRLMEHVVNKGTGKTASIPETLVAGKTATSQTGIFKNDEEILNAWFGGYFPADNPRWAVVVLAEEGKSGASDAAPVFRKIAAGMVNCFSIIPQSNTKFAK